MPEEPREDGRFPNPPSDDDIVERLRKVREELAGMELPDLPDEEVDARRQKLTDAVGHGELPQVPDWDPPQPVYKQDYRPGQDRGVGVGLQIAYTIIGMPIMGLGLGWLVDHFAGTRFGLAVGVLLGMALGLYVAAKMMIEQEKR